MNDFSVLVYLFMSCLNNLEGVLERCVEKKLILNWKKLHFMVTEGIMLVHKISARVIEVDQAVGAILGKKRNGIFQAIYYASKVLNGAQINYTTTEKEMLAVVYAIEKF